VIDSLATAGEDVSGERTHYNHLPTLRRFDEGDDLPEEGLEILLPYASNALLRDPKAWDTDIHDQKV